MKMNKWLTLSTVAVLGATLSQQALAEDVTTTTATSEVRKLSIGFGSAEAGSFMGGTYGDYNLSSKATRAEDSSISPVGEVTLKNNKGETVAVLPEYKGIEYLEQWVSNAVNTYEAQSVTTETTVASTETSQTTAASTEASQTTASTTPTEETTVATTETQGRQFSEMGVGYDTASNKPYIAGKYGEFTFVVLEEEGGQSKVTIYDNSGKVVGETTVSGNVVGGENGSANALDAAKQWIADAVAKLDAGQTSEATGKTTETETTKETTEKSTEAQTKANITLREGLWNGTNGYDISINGDRLVLVNTAYGEMAEAYKLDYSKAETLPNGDIKVPLKKDSSSGDKTYVIISADGSSISFEEEKKEVYTLPKEGGQTTKASANSTTVAKATPKATKSNQSSKRVLPSTGEQNTVLVALAGIIVLVGAAILTKVKLLKK